MLSKAVKFIMRRRDPGPDPPVETVINGGILSLPVELLQQIRSYLPLPSAAAFAFSNRHICDAVGQQLFAELRKTENKVDKLIFLALMQKDQEVWLCENCERLHPRDFDRRRFCEDDDGFEYPFGYRLPSRLVQLAIERQQKGPPYGICPDRLSCAGIFRTPEQRLDYAYRVRVVEGELILRMDVRIRLEEGLKGCSIFLEPCPHRRYTPYDMESKQLQNVHLSVEPVYHSKADYPYIPRDKGDSGTDLDPRLLRKLFLATSRMAGGWPTPSACTHCFCVTGRVRNESYGLWTESLARSYQNVGSGRQGDEKWIRAMSWLGTLNCFEDIRRATQELFEREPPAQRYRD
jgi:hypothetical protein